MLELLSDGELFEMQAGHRQSPRLFGFDACLLDARAPGAELLSDELAELFRRARSGLGEKLGDALLDRGSCERLVGLGVQRMDDVVRGTGGRADRKPGRKVGALESPRFCHCWETPEQPQEATSL